MDRTASRRLILTFVISLVVYAVACFSPVAWSPDSRWLAFTVGKQKDVKGPDGKAAKEDYCQLWLWAMPDGPGKLLAEGAFLSAPASTLDGKRVLFIECDPKPIPAEKPGAPAKRPSRLVSLETEMGGRTVLAQLPPINCPGASMVDEGNLTWFAPSISPDGKKVVLTIPDGHDTSIYLAECDTGKTRLLLRHAACARWSPDGNWIGYVHEIPGFIQGHVVEAMQVENGKRVFLGALYDCTGNELCPSWRNVSWHPDSKRVAYTSCIRPGLDKNGQEAVYIADLDGTRTEFFRGDKERSLMNPVWSPDGTRMAIGALIRGASDNEVGAALMLLDYPSKKLSVLAEGGPTGGLTAYTMPSWSPDGRWIAVRLGGGTPVLVPTDGTAKRHLVYDDESAAFVVLEQICSLKVLEVRKQFAEARQKAAKLLQFIDDHEAEFVRHKAASSEKPQGVEEKEAVGLLKLYPLCVLNRFEEVVSLGKGKTGSDKMSEEYVREAQAALGHYDQIKDADKTVKEAKDAEKDALDAKEPAESARLWLAAGHIWYVRLMNKSMALQAFENAAKALPDSPEAKLAQEKIAEIKARFGEEGQK